MTTLVITVYRRPELPTRSLHDRDGIGFKTMVQIFLIILFTATSQGKQDHRGKGQ